MGTNGNARAILLTIGAVVASATSIVLARSPRLNGEGGGTYPGTRSRPADNKQRDLGARLFRDSTLSLDSTLSCATCHVPTRAFAETRARSAGIGHQARMRNAPSLVNVTVFRSSFDWDGRAVDLEHQLTFVFSATGDMGLDASDVVTRLRHNPEYRAMFRQVYGRLPDEAGMVKALVAFEAGLVIGGSAFDRYYLNGDSTALSAEAIRGWGLFRRVGCAGCHVPLPDPGGSGILAFSDDKFHNLGVGYKAGRMDDVGHFMVTHKAEHWGAFRTPSLHNVALTGPYMHDGSLKTLRDVLRFYVRGGQSNPHLDVVILPLSLSSRDLADLEAFLTSLTIEWLTDSAAVQRFAFRGMQ